MTWDGIKFFPLLFFSLLKAGKAGGRAWLFSILLAYYLMYHDTSNAEMILDNFHGSSIPLGVCDMHACKV